MEAFDKDPAPAGATVQFAALLAVKVSWSAGNRMVDTGSGVTVNAVAGASMAITLSLAGIVFARVPGPDGEAQAEGEDGCNRSVFLHFLSPVRFKLVQFVV